MTGKTFNYNILISMPSGWLKNIFWAFPCKKEDFLWDFIQKIYFTKGHELRMIIYEDKKPLQKGGFMADLTVATVNVNGLRAAVKKGMGKWFEQRKKDLDVLCLQETKISEDKDEEDIISICKELGINKLHLQEDKYIPGHAGVAVWVKETENCQVESVKYPFEENRDEAEGLGFSGRWQEIIIEIANKKISIVNSYYHSANSPTYKINGILIDPEKSKESMKAKHCFLDRTTKQMRELISVYDNFILVGDINTAHHDIDIDTFEDSQTKTKAGFLPEERAWLDLWFAKEGDMNVQSTYDESKTAMAVYTSHGVLRLTGQLAIDFPPQTDEFAKGGLGLHDVIREQYRKDTKVYSWWSARPTPKVFPAYPFDRDVGWRIDYQIASENMANSVKKINRPREEYLETYEKRWSDHAPVVVTYSI
jgi:exodeoxyribonuclease-3